MQKQAPSIGRILIAIGFALSCFGLILFLWIAFGGPIPLKPESYRITAYFPEATQLAVESDVRIGGVSVGKVKQIELAPPEYRVDGNDTTAAEIEIEPEFAPISSDAQAILRQKTLLGETYVELTPGSEPGANAAPVALGAAANASDAEAKEVETVPEGGTLGVGHTENATQIDEIFNALDRETRTSFQEWMAGSATAIDGRGLDLNDAFGNLGPFVSDSAEILAILKRQKAALKGLVRDTGTTFEALTAHDQQLAGMISNSNQTFDALASQEQALRQLFGRDRVFATFQRESRATFERLDEFQANTDPLVLDLIPVAHDLSPTLQSLRELSPNLKSLFVDLDELIDASREGLPALERFLDGVSPVLDALDPFLANLNPVIRYLGFQRSTVADFLVGPSAALANSLEPVPGQPAARHYLRQLSYTSSEVLAVHPQRLNTNRGNGYLQPGALNGPTAASTGIFPNFDCKNTDYGSGSSDPDEDEATGDSSPSDVNGGSGNTSGFASCVIQDEYGPEFGGLRFPQLFADP